MHSLCSHTTHNPCYLPQASTCSSRPSRHVNMELQFLDKTYHTSKALTTTIRQPDKHGKALARVARLKELYANRRMCSRCRSVIREAATSRRKTANGVTVDFHGVEGRSCPFCFLFYSLLSNYKKELLDLNESLEKWIDDVPATVTFQWSDNIRLLPISLFSEIYFRPPSVSTFSLVSPKGDFYCTDKLEQQI